MQKTDSKYSDYLGSENKSTMYLKYIELFEIFDEIKKIWVTKAMGFDEIAPKVVKWVFPCRLFLGCLNGDRDKRALIFGVFNTEDKVQAPKG